jgi:acyl-CoA thioester hydrolase
MSDRRRNVVRFTRARFPHFLVMPTRWMDNDVYGHVNNVVYYSFFDTVINRYLVESGLDIARSAAIGLCVESHCTYLKAVSFPDDLYAGLGVAHLGKASVRYEIGIFARGDDAASAQGWFVHVFVDRETRKSTPIPERLREALERIAIDA